MQPISPSLHLPSNWLPLSGIMAGLFTPAAVETFCREAYLKSEVLCYASSAGIAGLAIVEFGDNYDQIDAWIWVAACAVGLGLAVVWYRFCSPWLSHKLVFFTRPSESVRSGRTDVRSVTATLPPPRKPSDPREHYRGGANADFFMGLDVRGKAIYWKGPLPHVSVVGTTGSGKGRKLQCLSTQSIGRKELLVYLDPKDDEWAPHAVFAACVRYVADYHFLRLLPGSPYQINLIEGASADEVEELFVSALDLGDTGAPSDFYAAKNRKAARAAAMLAAAQQLTLAELHQHFETDEYWIQEAPGFIDKLGELARLHAINAPTSAFSLANMIQNGGAIYVVGSMTLPSVRRAQQMIFVRIQQLASARDRLAGDLKTVCVVADEARYHLSRPIIQGLAASRDKGMRVILAYQSFLDLRDCPAGLDPQMVAATIIENTPCKLVYRVEDPDTAEWLARRSGTILVDDPTISLKRNPGLGETSDGERSVRQGEHYLFDTNKLTNLPSGWGLLFGQGIAKACFVSALKVQKSRHAISPTLAPSNGNQDVSGSPEHLTVRSINGQRKIPDFFSLEDQ
ncbi:TraM recognition domain-containing protein [Burkholderiaceae bacterium DAT-1]|nr:TraM recognition domain-containing protein [Burkholderiaceae bacterium DAT-1]